MCAPGLMCGPAAMLKQERESGVLRAADMTELEARLNKRLLREVATKGQKIGVKNPAVVKKVMDHARVNDAACMGRRSSNQEEEEDEPREQPPAGKSTVLVSRRETSEKENRYRAQHAHAAALLHSTRPW